MKRQAHYKIIKDELKNKHHLAFLPYTFGVEFNDL